MKKVLDFRYWIIGAAIGIAAISFVAYEQHRAAEKYKHHRAEYCAALIATAEQKKSCIEESTSARDYLPWWYELFRWPEGITTWAIILTGFAIAWQSVETHAAAEAALLNAQAVINAERALLLFRVEKEQVSGLGGPAIFHINVVNYGKVPARRLEISNPIQAVMTLDDLVSVSPPGYGENLEDIQEWLAPQESWRVATFCPYEKRNERAVASLNREIEIDMIEVVIYGQVTYYDGMSPELRHSRYCLAHDREPFRNIGGSLAPVGTEEYLECT